jgi:hypothetical protein
VKHLSVAPLLIHGLNIVFIKTFPGSRAGAGHGEVHARALDVDDPAAAQGRAIQGQLLPVRLHSRQVRRRERNTGKILTVRTPAADCTINVFTAAFLILV